MMADTITRFKEGKPVLYYTRPPYWVSDVMKPGKDVVWLQVPFSSAGRTEILILNRRTARTKGSVNTMYAVANKRMRENPAAANCYYHEVAAGGYQRAERHDACR